jgi:hypothetical protein
MCRGVLLAYVTQNGPEFGLLTEGRSALACLAADGMLIQFDNGTIWHRDLLPVPPPPRISR